MTYGTDTLYDFAAYDPERSSPRGVSRSITGGLAIAGAAFAGACLLYAGLPSTSAVPVAVARPAPVIETARTDRIDPTFPTDPYTYAALFDSAYASGSSNQRPSTFAQSAPLESVSRFALADIAVGRDIPPPGPAPVRQFVQIVPLPPPRPAELDLPQGRNALLPPPAQRDRVVATAPPNKPSIFERLFGKPQAFKPALAYASPDGGIFGDGQSVTPGGSPPYDRLTAVYDISAHTVYMPDGTKLEAHSGLGSRLDDPRHVAERMRGPTPPHVYDLEPRESLFHGVRALRLIPVGGSNPFGRTGLLAHSYMLGPNGDSNGCVSFRNYNAFLHAYLNRKVKRLVVVAHVD